MSSTNQKREIGLLDGKPEKRLYWSISSDYSIKTALCELIDNAIDIWIATKPPRKSLFVDINLDVERQLITIKDTAGGVKYEYLRLLVAPGASNNDPNAESIGYFGVGSKRAVVALAENTIIKTRHGILKSYQIDVTKEWIATNDWDIPHFEIPDIEEGVTILELSSLIKSVGESDVDDIRQHIGETYEWFLQIDGCKIKVNDQEAKPLTFDQWAFPPDFPPVRADWLIELKGHSKIQAEIIVGLITDRDPILENYGVYFYCNNRLIVKELKTREVGYFVTSQAGVPHPDISLCRAIVRLNGPAKLMPWNSNKSGINFSHPAFHDLRSTLTPLLHQFSSLSRRLKNDWNGNVFKHEKGEIGKIDHIPAGSGKKLILPQLPTGHKPHLESLKSKNKQKIDDEPWTLGLIEAVAAVEIINSKKLDTRNRISLILLDSNFEIALKEFIVHRDDLFPTNQFGDLVIHTLFQKRYKVIEAVSQKIQIPKKLLDKVYHYYLLRNKLIHERATVGVTDVDIETYKDTIQKILKILFDIEFD